MLTLFYDLNKDKKSILISILANSNKPKKDKFSFDYKDD